MTCCEVCEALEIAIKKCDIELDEIRNGHSRKPPTFLGNNEGWADLLEERHEYLEGFRGHLDFLLHNKNRKEMQV